MNGNQAEQLFVLLLIIAMVVLVFHRRRWRGSGTACGTARWATPKDLQDAGMLACEGLILGRASNGQLIMLPRQTVHAAIFASTGAGKGISFLIPWLLTYRWGSCVVVDPKGENYQITAQVRRAMGQKVVRLDPFLVCGEGADTWNPLDLSGKGPDGVDDARAMAEALVTRPADGEKDPHFSDQGAAVLGAALSLILARMCGAERHLGALREFITLPEVFKTGAGLLDELGGIYRRLAGLLAQLAATDKEGASVLSTCQRHSTFLDSEPVLRSLSTSSFDARELLDGNMTIFLILPPYQLEAQSRWLRLIISSLIRLIGREGMRHGKLCQFFIDEAGTAIGHMPAIEQGLTLLRSYGLRMALFFQSIGQLSETFRGKESVLLDNTDQIYFGVRSLETADRVSRMLGTASIVTEAANEGRSHNWHGPASATDAGGQYSSGLNWSEQPRELLKAAEVLTMNGDDLVAFLTGVPPIYARRIKYFEITWYEEFLAGVQNAGGNFNPVWWLLAAALVALAVMYRY